MLPLPCCQVNWNGFPVEIPGTVDLHNHAHPFGVFIKSHEDTLSCLDTLCALQVVMESAHGQPLPLCRFVSDRAWAFLNSNLEALAAQDVQVGIDSYGSCYAHFMRALEKADSTIASVSFT
jgi:hypothetical protein